MALYPHSIANVFIIYRHISTASSLDWQRAHQVGLREGLGVPQVPRSFIRNLAESRLVVYGSPAQQIFWVGSKTKSNLVPQMLDIQVCSQRERERDRTKKGAFKSTGPPFWVLEWVIEFSRDLATEFGKRKCERFRSQIDFPICAMAVVHIQLVSSTAIDDLFAISSLNMLRSHHQPQREQNPVPQMIQSGLPFFSYRNGPKTIRMLVSNEANRI